MTTSHKAANGYYTAATGSPPWETLHCDKSAMTRASVWIGLGLALAVALGGAWVWQGHPATVTVERARNGPAADLVYATGYVEAQQPVSVSSRITAPVAKVLVEEGDHVRRGQPLVVLADEEQRALLDQSAAQLRSAQQVEHRTLVLFKDGWVTAAARDNAVTTADAARAARATAIARLDQLVVRANSDGIVTKRDVYPGDMATPTKVLFQLGDPAKIRITATVDERDIARVRVGQAALMSSDAWPGRVIHARVAELTPSGDPTARAFRVRLLPDTVADLPMGLTLEVNIVAHERSGAVLVPPTAIVNGKDAANKDNVRVWVVREGHVYTRAVHKGASGATAVEITDGLKVGETVVTNPPALTDGQRVRPAQP